MAQQSIFERLRAWFTGSQRGAPPAPYSPESLGPVGVAVTSALPYGTPPARGSRELAVAGKREPWLFAVTDKIGRSISAVPWTLGVSRDRSGDADPVRAKHYGRLRAQIASTYEPSRRKRHMRDLRREMKVEEIYEHPLLDLFDRPNPLHSGVQFRSLIQRHMDLTGEIFLVKERNKFGMPVQLWPVPNFWCRMTPYLNSPEFLFSYGMFMRSLPETEVVWMRHLDLENPYARGMGPGFALADVIETYAYALKTEKAFYYNFGMPPVVIGMEGASDAQLKQIREKWDERHGGYWNAMKIAWVNFKLSIANLGPKFVDAEMLAQQNQKRDTIIQVYGVPPEVLGIVENSNRASAVTSRRIFAEEVLVPRLEDQRGMYQMQLVPEFDESLILDYVSPVPDDREQDITVFQSVPTTLTVNEWRELGNMPPLEDGTGDAMYSAGSPGGMGGFGLQAPRRALPAKRAQGTELSKAQVDQLVSAMREAGTFDALGDATAEALESFGDMMLKQIADSYSGDHEVPDAFNVRNPRVKSYLEDSSATRIEGIDDATEDYLREYFTSAYDKGLSIDDMVADLTSDTNMAFGSARAENIARTEVLGASNFGTLEGYRQSGVVEKKGWMATPGTKGSRESHESLDGVVIGIDEVFTDSATGATALHPGGFGDPASDCNCRCAVYAVIDNPNENGLRAAKTVKMNHKLILNRREKHEDSMRDIASSSLSAQRKAVIAKLSKMG